MPAPSVGATAYTAVPEIAEIKACEAIWEGVWRRGVGEAEGKAVPSPVPCRCPLQAFLLHRHGDLFDHPDETRQGKTASRRLWFFHRWVDGFSEQGQPSTNKAYNTTCNRVTAHTRGQLRYGQLSPAFIRKWGHSLAAPEPHGEGLKQNCVRKQLTTLRKAFRSEDG